MVGRFAGLDGDGTTRPAGTPTGTCPAFRTDGSPPRPASSAAQPSRAELVARPDKQLERARHPGDILIRRYVLGAGWPHRIRLRLCRTSLLSCRASRARLLLSSCSAPWPSALWRSG